MRKWLCALLAICLGCSMLAGCGEKEESGETKDESSGKIVSIREYSFEVPESWEEGDNTEDLLYYYPEDAMLMVGYSEVDQSILDERARKEFIDSFGASMDKFTIVSETKQDVAGQNAYRYEMNISMADEDWAAEMIIYDSNDGVISFLMSTLADSEYNYDKEFENILSSLSLNNGAASEGKNKGNEADSKSVEQNIDVKASSTIDGAMCVFITNNSSTIIDELEVQINYKNADGETIDTDSDGHDMVLPGSTVVSRIDAPESYDDYEIQKKIELDEHPRYENHTEDVVVNSSQGEKCIIVEITNNADVTIDEIEYIAVLYKGNDIVKVEYPKDVYDVEPGQLVTEKINTYDEYDRFEVYLNQAHTFGL